MAWGSKLQRSVALSTVEAEYMALSAASQEVLYFQHVLADLDIPFESAVIRSDNTGCLSLAKNPEGHSRAKHIDTRYHFVRELVQRKLVHLEHVSTKRTSPTL